MPIATSNRSAVFHRSLSRQYGTATSGSGVYILHPDGSRTLDGSSGAAVSCLGHGHPAVIDALVHQAQQLAFVHTSFFTNNPAEELARFLIYQSNRAFTHVMLLSSGSYRHRAANNSASASYIANGVTGSEAVESAIKLARHYHISRRDNQRVNIISRKYVYHGNTLGALSAGYNPPRRQPFEPLLSQAFHHVSPCWFTRDGRREESEEAYVDRLMVEFEECFERLGPSSVAAVLIEPISGATLGAVPAARTYLARLRGLCDRLGALLIYDEVMCGMGRAGMPHAWQSLGDVAPDLQTIGKGLAAGYQPISAVLVSNKVRQAMEAGEIDNPFVSGHTYQGHAIGCAAALATQRTIQDQDLLTNVKQMGDTLEQKLRLRTPKLKEVRGLGLFRAVKFDTAGEDRVTPKIAAKCLEKGLAVYQCSPVVDAILFAPPFIISEDEIETLVQTFVVAAEEVFNELKTRPHKL